MSRSKAYPPKRSWSPQIPPLQGASPATGIRKKGEDQDGKFGWSSCSLSLEHRSSITAKRGCLLPPGSPGWIQADSGPIRTVRSRVGPRSGATSEYLTGVLGRRNPPGPTDVAAESRIPLPGGRANAHTRGYTTETHPALQHKGESTWRKPHPAATYWL